MKYKIGDWVYLASYENRSEELQCPICFGGLRVTLILGNGDSVILPCEYCRVGYDGPFGKVSEYIKLPRVEQCRISEIECSITEDGEKYDYRTENRTLGEANIFSTKEEADKRALDLAAQATKEEQSRTEYLKHEAKKSFSWNAGYHLSESKRAFESAKYHMEKAVLCKQKAKEKPEATCEKRE